MSINWSRLLNTWKIAERIANSSWVSGSSIMWKWFFRKSILSFTLSISPPSVKFWDAWIRISEMYLPSEYSGGIVLKSSYISSNKSISLSLKRKSWSKSLLFSIKLSFSIIAMSIALSISASSSEILSSYSFTSKFSTRDFPNKFKINFISSSILSINLFNLSWLVGA